jgi:hypothetical protein
MRSDRQPAFYASLLRAVHGWTGERLTGEDIRLRCIGQGICPGHPNAWGTYVIHLIRCGLLRPTDGFRSMRAPGSNGRLTRVYLIEGRRAEQ